MNAPVRQPRVRPVVDPSPELAELLDKTLMRPGQEPLNVFRTLAVHPLMLRRCNQLTGTFIANGSLPARERELVILRVANRTRCEYEWRQHLAIARRAGLVDEEIEQIRLRPIDQWPADDRTLLAMTDELIDDDDICDATWNQLRVRWDDACLVELVLLVGCYRMMAGLMRALRVDVDA